MLCLHNIAALASNEIIEVELAFKTLAEILRIFMNTIPFKLAWNKAQEAEEVQYSHVFISLMTFNNSKTLQYTRIHCEHGSKSAKLYNQLYMYILRIWMKTSNANPFWDAFLYRIQVLGRIWKSFINMFTAPQHNVTKKLQSQPIPISSKLSTIYKIFIGLHYVLVNL